MQKGSLKYLIRVPEFFLRSRSPRSNISPDSSHIVSDTCKSREARTVGILQSIRDCNSIQDEGAKGVLRSLKFTKAPKYKVLPAKLFANNTCILNWERFDQWQLQ